MRGHLDKGVGAVVREAVMDYAPCNVVYVDRAATEDKLVKRKPVGTGTGDSTTLSNALAEYQRPLLAQRSSSGSLDANLTALLRTFHEGSSSILPLPQIVLINLQSTSARLVDPV